MPGDIVGIDVGVLLDGYHADAAITVPVGAVAPGVNLLLKTTKHALTEAVHKMKPGIRLGVISETIESIAKAQGFDVVHDLFGHGVGRDLHEDPMIPNFGTAKTGPILKEGMVLAVEPMLVMGAYAIEVLKDGWTVVTQDRRWSAHEEYTIAVTKNGYRILT